MTAINLLEIELPDNNGDAFLKIRETLTRMGIANNKNKVLTQSCHILNKRGKIYIVHFKELLALDGREVQISDEDIERRNDIAQLLQEWNLCTIVNPSEAKTERLNKFRVITYHDATEGGWTLQHKYAIGKYKNINV